MINLRNCIIFLFTIIILYFNQPWAVQADTTTNNDDDILSLMVPIIATFATTDNPLLIKYLWEQYAPLCQPNINGNSIAPYPSKGDTDCNDGDMTLFNGLLCASGDQRGCDAVKRSQSPDGRFWRSPRRALTNNLGMGDNDTTKSFSSDMANGALLYIIKTGDKEALYKWFRWINANAKGSLPRFCDSSDCTIRFIEGALLCQAAKAFGLTPSYSLATGYCPYVWDINQLIYSTVAVNEVGFPRHLAGIYIWIMRLLGDTDKVLHDAADLLAPKEPRNPFFAYLNQGATDYVRDLTLQLCPATVEDVQKSTLSEWAWERTDSDMAWKKSMLWDCIFMANLFTNQNAPVSIDDFRLGPKPFSDYINCFFKINVTAEVTIKIFNDTGDLVLKRSDTVGGGQETQWTLDTNQLASNVYFVKIYAGNDSRTIKVKKI